MKINKTLWCEWNKMAHTTHIPHTGFKEMLDGHFLPIVFCTSLDGPKNLYHGWMNGRKRISDESSLVKGEGQTQVYQWCER